MYICKQYVFAHLPYMFADAQQYVFAYIYTCVCNIHIFCPCFMRGPIIVVYICICIFFALNPKPSTLNLQP